MEERLSKEFETALSNLVKYGLKPSIYHLEELVRLDHIASDPNDGWVVTPKGYDYIKLFCT